MNDSCLIPITMSTNHERHDFWFIPHIIENDQFIVDKNFDLSEIKLLSVTNTGCAKYINEFLQNYEEELCNLNELYITIDVSLTFVPKTVRKILATHLVTTRQLVLEKLDLNNYINTSYQILDLDPFAMKSLKFEANKYQIPNINEMINLEELTIINYDKLPEITSDKLIKFNLYDGIGELPVRVQELGYCLVHYDYSFKYLQLKQLYLIIVENINCEMENSNLEKLTLQIKTPEFNNISFNFPSLKDLEIFFRVKSFDERYIYEFLKTTKLDYLKLSNFDQGIVNIFDEWMFDYDINNVELEKVNINLIFKNNAYYTFGKRFTAQTSKVIYQPIYHEKEIEFDSETMEEIKIKLIEQKLTVKLFCPNMKRVIIDRYRYANSKENYDVYLISMNEDFDLTVFSWSKIIVYLNNELIKKNENIYEIE